MNKSGLIRKKLPALFYLFILFSMPSYALPPKAQFDLMKIQLVEHVKAEDHAGALKTITKMRELNFRLPASIDYFEGKALLGVNKPGEAKHKLESYITNQGEKGKYYTSALKGLIRAESSKKTNHKEAMKSLVDYIHSDRFNYSIEWYDSDRFSKKNRSSSLSTSVSDYSDCALSIKRKRKQYDLTFKSGHIEAVVVEEGNSTANEYVERRLYINGTSSTGLLVSTESKVQRREYGYNLYSIADELNEKFQRISQLCKAD